MKKDILSNKQEQFVLNLVEGMSQREAYKEAYGAKYSDNAIDTKASQLFKKDKVKNRYEELINKVKKKAEEKVIMSATERMEWLTDLIKDNTTEIEITQDKRNKKIKTTQKVIKTHVDIDARLRALDILNKMDGQYRLKTEGDLLLNIKLEDVL